MSGRDVDVSLAAAAAAVAAAATSSTAATESLFRVTTLMHRQREMHPTLFKVNWYEELFRNFKQTLAYAYKHLFEWIKMRRDSKQQQQ